MEKQHEVHLKLGILFYTFILHKYVTVFFYVKWESCIPLVILDKYIFYTYIKERIIYENVEIYIYIYTIYIEIVSFYFDVFRIQIYVCV